MAYSGRQPWDANDPYPDDGEPEDELAMAELECGLHRDGQCSLAGSEHCDFICPFRSSEDFAGSAAWIAKHGRENV